LKSPNPRNYFSRKQNGEVSEGEREMEAKEKRGEAVDEVGLDWEFVGVPDAVEEALVVFGEGGLGFFGVRFAEKTETIDEGNKNKNKYLIPNSL
jgi:hypothetical protein